MINQLVELDKQIFLYLNSKNSGWLDPIMLILSSYELWTVMFILFGVIIFLCQKKYKIVSVIFYVLSVLLSTALTNLLKLIVQRPRPIHEEVWKGVIHNIEKHSEAFSFFSSHAATTFCIATFVFLVCKARRYFGYIAYVWAFGVSYSRIYVSKHYPLDVMVGTLFGILIGYVGYRLLTKYISSKEMLTK